MNHAIIVGGIYWVEDSHLTLLPRKDRPLQHPRRSVIVVSGPETNSDEAWPFVLVCPLSSSTRRRTRFCVKIAAGGSAGANKKVWVRVPAVQPMEKELLQDRSGVASEEQLQAVQARLVEYLGLLDLEEDPADPVADFVPPPPADDDVPF